MDYKIKCCYLKLADKYTLQKRGVKHTTQAGYRTVLNILKDDPFGAKRIDKVKLSDAKIWLDSASGEWKELQFHSFHQRGIKTSIPANTMKESAPSSKQGFAFQSFVDLPSLILI